MKKVIILVMLVLLTGCTANYNLTINEDGTFDEKITGTVTKKELDNGNRTDNNPYLHNLNTQTPLIFDEGIYKKSIIDKGNYKEFTYSYTFDNNYEQSSILNGCYEKVVFDETDEYYTINLSGKFNCMYGNKINIKIITDLKVIENNANKVKDNTYTWIIKNKKNSDINIVISKNEYSSSSNKIKTFRIIGFIILIILSAVTYLLYKKNSSDN